jgi:hypothetical protein
MTAIYSSKAVDGLDGQYIDAFRFSGVEKGVELVYTDDDNIRLEYEANGIEVKRITNNAVSDTPLDAKPKKQTKVVS